MIVSEAQDRIDLTAVPAVIPNQIGSQDARATRRTHVRQDRSGDGPRDLPGGAVERRRCAAGGRDREAGAARVGGDDRRQARRHPPSDCDADARAPRRDRVAGGPRDRQVEEGRARRDRCRDRDGLLRRRRGAPLLRSDDDQRRAEQGGDGRASAARGGRSDHRGQHADRQRRVEGVSGAAVRQRGDSEGVGGHAAVRVGVWRARA